MSGPDDYASIAEAVTRRYKRLLEQDEKLPDLVLIDGGAGQRAAAVGALAHVGLPMLPVAAIAKREEELYLEGAASRCGWNVTRRRFTWFSGCVTKRTVSRSHDTGAGAPSGR